MLRLILASALLGLADSSWALKTELLRGLLGSGPVVEIVAERVLVKFSTTAAAGQKAAALQTVGGSVSNELLGWTIVELPPGRGVMGAIDQLKGLPGVEMAAPDHVYRPNLVPNDPGVPQQYALSQVNAFAAWEFGTGSSNKVTIAVIDSGIKGDQPDLAPKLLNSGGVQSQFFNPNAGGAQSANHPPTPACNHATRTASIAAAASGNGIGIAGISWGAQLLSLKIFHDNDCNTTGSCPGTCATSDSAMAAAIDYATSLQNNAAVGKVVINLSVGGPGSCPGCPGANCIALTQTAIANAVAAGIPVVISAGNQPYCSSGATGINAPANCAGTGGPSGVIPVGATDSNNSITAFSCTGPELAANGVVAPGGSVLVDDISGATTQDSGTSFSAPHVAGLAALILSEKPALNAIEVQNVIRAAADNIGVAGLMGLDAGGRPLGNTSGAGRINAFRAMRLAVKGTLADFAGDQEAIAFPNPFRVSRTGAVSFSVPTGLQGTKTAIKIYASSGEFVRELSGLTWDGKNTSGNPVATGTYIFVVSTDKGTTRGRVAVIR
ncbi:MAG TPA: hypothetical protein DEB40_09545 [Elusimicrobia bacterium]|nr:hypothetical protein [Elusimicrobiota bacterium]HBT61972.1 hypothetical protein [Elusimicrobiota bacterium]